MKLFGPVHWHAMPPDLQVMLDRAGVGDQAAFMGFYDHTIAKAAELARIAVAPDAVDDVLAAAYRQAWDTAHTHRETGWQPLTWLLALVHAAVAAAEKTARPAV